MQIFILISLVVFFSLSILFLVLYLKMKQKCVNTSQELDKSNQELTNFKISTTKKFQILKDDLSTKKSGYYKETVNLITDSADPTKTKPYDSIVYIRELDRYTNGVSKIELVKIEVTSGFDVYQYDWIKKCLQSRFASLKKTSDIEWLESEEKLKEQRKQKLQKIINLENDK